MKEFSKFQVATLKRVAQSVSPLVRAKEKLVNQITECEQELKSIQIQIDAFQGPIKEMTGGYTTEDLVVREVSVTDKLDKEVEKINKNLEDNYLLKTTFNTYVQANDAEVKALKDNLSAVKDVLVEAYEIAGADNLTLAQTLKAAIDANNEKLAEVDQAIEDLKKADENLQKASDYAKGLVDELEKKLNAKIDAVAADVNKLLARVQSVVYVPDYDDNKITVNLAALYDASIVELEEEQAKLGNNQPESADKKEE